MVLSVQGHTATFVLILLEDFMDDYQSSLNSRYSSQAMKHLFSDTHKYTQWRMMWVALAKAQQQVGYPIHDEQIAQMESYVNDINFDDALEFENQTQHDVMAHILAYGKQCPKAQGIIHLGATSAFVSDNSEMLTQIKAVKILRRYTINIINLLSEKAKEYADLMILGYTHYQPAQPTTLGKRLAMYIQDFMDDLEEINHWLDHAAILGCKGTTGTQASFMTLFNNDEEKVLECEKIIGELIGCTRILPISGQTYSRKRDSITLNLCSYLAQSASKLATDIRLMQHDQILSEPFRSQQVGSSAMAYKRNPILSERVCGLARYVQVNALNGPLTASNQWLERTLDDSANRRLVLAETFLATDAILILIEKIVRGLQVNKSMIQKQLNQQLPFLITETLLMECVNRKGNRQYWHEVIRDESMKVTKNLLDGQSDNDLILRLCQYEKFPLTLQECEQLMQNQDLSGRAKNQTLHYLSTVEKRLKEQQYD